MRVEKLRVAVASCELQLRVASSVFRRFQHFPRSLFVPGIVLLSWFEAFRRLTRPPRVRKIITPTVLFDDCEK